MPALAKKKKKKVNWHKKAWDVFSRWIRNRDNGVCFTCGAFVWNEELGTNDIRPMQAGHYRHGVLDFDEQNINCQCVRCNHWLSGNLGEYTLKLIDKYGIKAVNDLRQRASDAQKGKKMSEDDYREIIKKYS